jgi:hypothetical protein
LSRHLWVNASSPTASTRPRQHVGRHEWPRRRRREAPDEVFTGASMKSSTRRMRRLSTGRPSRAG